MTNAGFCAIHCLLPMIVAGICHMYSCVDATAARPPTARATFTSPGVHVAVPFWHTRRLSPVSLPALTTGRVSHAPLLAAISFSSASVNAPTETKFIASGS